MSRLTRSVRVTAVIALVNASTTGSPLFGGKLLEVSIGKDFGALKGLNYF